MKLSYFGHAACLLETEGAKLLFDPFLSGNDHCTIDPKTVKCDYILLTHAHDDHVGDTIEIAKANDATVIANNELASFLSEKHDLKVEPMHIGGGINLPFGRVKLTIAFHGSSYPGEDGLPIYLGMPAGIIVESGGTCFYHAGDTALFGDMKLIGEMHNIGLAMLPIGDRFTMGPEDAAKATELLNPKYVVPIHYNTFALIEQDPSGFAEAAHDLGVIPYIMECGDAVEF
ncbi:MAG: metal-dependent hydrolase [Verrucomicrobiota bacterium]